MKTDRPTTLNFITGNANKLAEIRAILGDVVNIESSALDIDEIQGTIEQIGPLPLPLHTPYPSILHNLRQ